MAAILATACGSPAAQITPNVASAERVPTLVLAGPTPRAPWERGRVEREEGPPLDIYVARVEGRRPVVVMLQGSNCLPLFGERVRPDGRRSDVSSMPFEDRARATDRATHLALVERVGVSSFGPAYTPEQWPPPRITPECEPRAVDKRLRVRDVADAVLALAAEPWVERVFLLGHSEGADVATGVAALLGSERIAAVGLMAGAGPTQFYDSVVLARRQGDNAGALQVLRDLLWFTQRERPADAHYEGAERYNVRRWATFALESTPLDDLLRAANIPVYIAQGGADTHVPIESADLVAAELLRRNRTVRYLMLPEVEHGFACDENGEDHTADVFSDFLAWSLDETRRSSVEERALCSPMTAVP